MSSTNRVQSYIIARVELMDVPIGLPKYMKPEEEWSIPGIPDYYSLNDIDGTDLLGHIVDIRKSVDNQWFVYSDSDMSYRFGWYDHWEQMAADLFGQWNGEDEQPIFILTTQAEIYAEMSHTAGEHQITQWFEEDGEPGVTSCDSLCQTLCHALGLGQNCIDVCERICRQYGTDAVKHCKRIFHGADR